MGQFHEEQKRIELDLLDRKILYLLSINARFSESSIAKALKISKEVVHYRIKGLQKKEFLHGFLTLLNHNQLGHVVHDVGLSLHPFSDHEELASRLLSIKQVTHIKRCSAPNDLQFRVTTNTIPDFIGVFDQFLGEHHGAIRDYTISTVLDELFLGLGFLVNNLEEKPTIVERKGPSFQKEFLQRKRIQKNGPLAPGESAALDEKDKAILQLLKLNARMPLLKISQQIKLATTSVQSRIQRLIACGVITHFIPYASFSFLGYQWHVLKLRTKNLDQTKFLQYLREHPNIVWMSRRLGRWNYQLSIFIRNNTELNKVVQDLRNNFLDSIIAYESEIVFKQYKFAQRVT